MQAKVLFTALYVFEILFNHISTWVFQDVFEIILTIELYDYVMNYGEIYILKQYFLPYLLTLLCLCLFLKPTCFTISMYSFQICFSLGKLIIGFKCMFKWLIWGYWAHYQNKDTMQTFNFNSHMVIESILSVSWLSASLLNDYNDL